MYHWELILEEYSPEIFYIKGIHNTVADAVSQLEFSPKAYPEQSDKQNWMNLTKYWCALEHDTENSNNEHEMDINHVFTHNSDEEDIYPPKISEIL